MVTVFRKMLIRLGKVIPFIFAFIICIGYFELIYSICNDRLIATIEGEILYYLPICNFISDIVYIDCFDVLLLYILAFALEFCKHNFRCVHYLALNLAVRTLIESDLPSMGGILFLCSVMALCGLFCLYGGLKMIRSMRK